MDRSILARVKRSAMKTDPKELAELLGGPDDSAEFQSTVEVDDQTAPWRRVAPVVAYPLYEVCKTVCLVGGVLRDVREMLELLSAIRLPLILASHNAVGPGGSIGELLPKKESKYRVASPYSTTDFLPLTSLASKSIITRCAPNPSKVTELLRGWKLMPEISSWGVEAAVVNELWDRVPTVIAVTDVISSLYGIYISSMIDVPVLDFSYVWMFTKGKNLWKDREGDKHAVQWTQWDVLRSTEDNIVLISCLEGRLSNRVANVLKSELDDHDVVVISSEDPEELGRRLIDALEDLPITGGELRRKLRVEPEMAKCVKRAVMAPLPVFKFNEVKHSRFRPLILDVLI